MKSKAIIAGFSFDVDSVLSHLPEGERCFRVDEKTPDGTELPEVDIVVYAFSSDTGWSSHLLSWFTWIHHHVKPVEEYIFSVSGDPNVEIIFHFIESQREKFPFITAAELRQRLG
jgi:hypothetical protein